MSLVVWRGRLLRPFGVAACVALVCAVVGCFGDGTLMVYPVTGKVFFRGQPAEGAELQFFGEGEELQSAMAPYPKATVLADGSFTVTSYDPNDGAPAGSYRVTVVWHKSDEPDPETRSASPDVLRGKYASPDSSPLTVEVQAGENQLAPFELD